MRKPIVLIVDENKITSSILKRMLIPYTYATTTATDPDEGVRLFNKYHPDIVLSDVIIGGVESFEMLKQMRQINSNISIAVFANFKKSDILARAIGSGIDQFFPKPFDVEQVRVVVEHMCANVQKQKQTLLELKRQQNMLNVISKMAENFLQHTDWHVALGKELLSLKQTASISSIFVYQDNSTQAASKAQQVLALHADTNLSIDKDIYYHQHYLMRWKKSLKNGECFRCIKTKCHPTEQQLLRSFGADEVFLLPIFVDAKWWGFLGVADVDTLLLTASDIRMLKTAASIIGSAINNQENIQALQLSSSLFEHTVEGAVVTDAKNKIIKVNRSFTEITGYEPSEVLGKDPKIFKSGKHNAGFYKRMWREIHTKDHWQGEVINRKKDGKIFFEWLRINAVRDDSGKIQRYIAIFSDVSHQRQDVRKYAHLATHDYLTNLPNRVLLSDRLEQAFLHAKRFEKKIAVIFCDLDNFKPINDTYGHDVGDELLKGIAMRLKSSLRQEDTVARYGGDEFVVLIDEFSEDIFLQTVVNKILRSLKEPIAINGVAIPVSMSIGVSVYPDSASTAESLLKMADKAMYQAKERGKNNAVFYEADEERAIDITSSSKIELPQHNT